MSSICSPRDSRFAKAAHRFRSRWLKTNFLDSRLNPVLRWVLAGVAVLSWVIQPRGDDSTLAISLLMFLRFVPVFVLVGSRFGRAGAGAVVGMLLFFAMMAAESLSFLAWDAGLWSSASKVAQQAAKVGNLLYLLAALSLVLCLAVIFHFNRGGSQEGGKNARSLLQVMMAVQLVLLLELVYLGYRNGWADELPRLMIKHTPAAAAKVR